MENIEYTPYIKESTTEYVQPEYNKNWLTEPVGYTKQYNLIEDTKEDIKLNTKDTVKDTKTYKSIFKDRQDFINTMLPIYQKVLKEKGLNPEFAKSLVGQTALESNWGKSQSGKFNLGGIKGKGTIRRTREVINGKDTYINASFRDFESLEDYARYHVSLLNNKRYQAFSGPINEFAQRVTSGGYATDPHYKEILQKVINSAKHGGHLFKKPTWFYRGGGSFTNSTSVLKAQNGSGNQFWKLISDIQNLKNHQAQNEKELQYVIDYGKQYSNSSLWTDDDIKYLHNKFKNNAFSLNSILKLMSSESSWDPKAKNPGSSARGLFQITKDTAKDRLKLSDDEWQQYENGTRTIKDQIDDARFLLSNVWKNLPKNKDLDKLTYGRLKVNWLAPNASLDKLVSQEIYDKSLSKEMKQKVKIGKTTYRDLMNIYDNE